MGVIGKRCISIISLLVFGITQVSALSSTEYYESSIKAPSIGNYEFKIETHEVPSKEYLPIVDKSYFPSTVISLFTEVDNLPPSATYDAKTLSLVDVVFAFGEMSQAQTMQDNIARFESMLGAAGNNIDAYVEKVETSKVDMQNAFEWIRDVSGSIGSINITNNGSVVAMYGNESNQGKNAIYVESENAGSKKHVFSFDYSLSYGDSFSAAGVMINIGKVDNVLSGYAITFNNRAGSFGNGGASICKINYYLGTNGEQFGRSNVNEITSLNLASQGQLTIEYTSSYIKVSGGGMSSAVSIECTSKYGSGIGFFSEHYSHGCDYIGYFALTNMSLQMDTSKSLGEAISDVAWRDNSTRFVVYGEDTVPDYMGSKDNADYQYTVSKLLNSNAYLINLGKSGVNSKVLNELVKDISTATETKGTFINNNPIISAMDSACNWIINLVKNRTKPTGWILVNEPVVWLTKYNDSEHDVPLNFGEHDGNDKFNDSADITISNAWGIGLTNLFTQDKIMAEKWRFRHNWTYYDNPTYEETFHDIWISDPVDIFPNPGLYRINYKRKDNPFYSDVLLTNPFDEYRYWSEDYDPVVSK